MLKPTLKLVRKQGEEQQEDRGEDAPVLTRPNRLANRLSQASRGYVLAGAGVVVGAVGFVSLLSWLAPNSDRPIGHPLEVVERVAGEVLEQVDDQIEALLGTDGETVLRDVRENLTAVGSRIPWSERVSGNTLDRSSASSDPSSPTPTIRSTSSAPAWEEPPSSAPDEPSPRTYTPSPSGSSLPSTTSETPPAAEPQSLATTDAPTTPPPATEEPATPLPVEEPPPTEEPPPPAEEPSTPPTEEPPPPVEEPPIEEVPPTGPPPTDDPGPPPTEQPPRTPGQPPQPPGLA